MDAELPNYKTGINRDVFVFCAFTGLSHSDVAKLPHTDIHTDDNRDRWIIDKDRKTGTQFRVKLLPVAEMINDRYKDLHLEGNKVFPIKSYYRTMNMSLRQVARHAGLPFNPTMHCFRHTFATLQLFYGTDIYTVSKLLGHRELKTTQIYTKVVDDAKRRAVNKITIELE